MKEYNDRQHKPLRAQYQTQLVDELHRILDAAHDWRWTEDDQLVVV